MAIKFLNTVQVDTDVLYVDASSNRVGIGTTTPSTDLEVSSTGVNGVDISQSASNSSQSGRLFFTTNTASEGFALFNSNGTFQVNSGGIPNNTSGTNRISIIGSSGNVGIGTTSPDSKLNIEGTKNTAILTLGNTTQGSSWVVGDRVGGIDFYSADGSGGGIGVKASISYEDALGGTGSSQAMVFRTGGTSAGTNNVERMRLQYNGNVGIGTTSPSEKLEVAGSVKATASTDAYKGYIKQSIACVATEKTASADYYLIPYNTLTTQTSDQYYNRMVAAYDGRIKKVYIRDTGGNTPTASVVNIKKQVNDVTSSTVYSTTVTGSGAGMSAVRDFADNDFTFSAGDSFGILYQTTDSGGGAQTMGGVAINIIIEYNIT